MGGVATLRGRTFRSGQLAAPTLKINDGGQRGARGADMSREAMYVAVATAAAAAATAADGAESAAALSESVDERSSGHLGEDGGRLVRRRVYRSHLVVAAADHLVAPFGPTRGPCTRTTVRRYILIICVEWRRRKGRSLVFGLG